MKDDSPLFAAYWEFVSFRGESRKQMGRELEWGRFEGCKGSLVPWPLEEIITAVLLLCQKKCTRRSAANTLKQRSCMSRGGVNKQGFVDRKRRCFVENVFPDIDNVLIDQFAVVYFCVSGEELFTIRISSAPKLHNDSCCFNFICKF